MCSKFLLIEFVVQPRDNYRCFSGVIPRSKVQQLSITAYDNIIEDAQVCTRMYLNFPLENTDRQIEQRERVQFQTTYELVIRQPRISFWGCLLSSTLRCGKILPCVSSIASSINPIVTLRLIFLFKECIWKKRSD